MANWVTQHLGQVLVSLLIGAPPHSSDRTRSVLGHLRAGGTPAEVADDLDAMVRSLQVPPAPRRTLIRMYVFVHDDGSASGGLETLDRPPEGCDAPDELARVHLADACLHRFSTPT